MQPAGRPSTHGEATLSAPAVLEGISDSFFAVDRDWKLTYVNAQAHQTFLTLTEPRDSYVGCDLWELFPPATAAPFYEAYHAAMSSGVARSVEAEYAPAGRWFEAVAYPTPEGLSVYNRDITARKAHESRLGSLYDLSVETVLATSLEATYAAALAAIRTALGVERASILLFDDDGVMRFKAAAGLSVRYQMAVEGHTPWKPTDREASPILVPDVHRDATLGAFGPVFDAEGIGSLGFFPLQFEGRVIGKFMVYYPAPREFPPEETRIAQTIASMLSVAIARRQAEAALRSSEAEFRALAESLPQLVWAAGPDGRIQYRNARAEAFASGGPDALWGLAMGAGSAAAREAWTTHVDGERDAFAVEVELVAREPGARPRWHLVHGVAIRSGDAVVRWLCTATDIQELRDAQDEAARSRVALARAEKLSALGMLVSGVAHEIRTPLTIIESNTHILERRAARASAEPGAGAAFLEPIREIREGVDRAAGLVRELRKFTKLEVNQRVVVDLSRATSDALHLLVATRKGETAVETRLSPDLAIVADPAQVQQIVLNLVSNALDATRGQPGRVRVVTGASGQAVQLVVEDDGPGLSPEVRRRLFEPLFTTKLHGTGLGLSIVKRIVDEHGGRIFADADVPAGARFVVEFPAASATHRAS